MEQIGAWLHSYAYFGPCGADILETSQSSGPSTLNIVDLNVRTSGSLVLGLMKGHFSDRRGLHEASSFSVTAKMTREAFIERFESDFWDGSMVIVSWYEDQESSVSYGNILIGAQNKGDLEKQGARVKEVAAEVHF